MRRGLIAVRAAGDFAAINMIAGTLLVFGPIGDRPAAGMRRGTLGLFGPEKPRLLPTFRACGCTRPLFLQLLFRELIRLEYAVDRALWGAEYQMHYGDLTTVGRGEVLSVACAGAGR
jgi:formylmethanofuran dehydrogenase subunit C